MFVLRKGAPWSPLALAVCLFRCGRRIAPGNGAFTNGSYGPWGGPRHFRFAGSNSLWIPCRFVWVVHDLCRVSLMALRECGRAVREARGWQLDNPPALVLIILGDGPVWFPRPQSARNFRWFYTTSTWGVFVFPPACKFVLLRYTLVVNGGANNRTYCERLFFLHLCRLLHP